MQADKNQNVIPRQLVAPTADAHFKPTENNPSTPIPLPVFAGILYEQRMWSRITLYNVGEEQDGESRSECTPSHA